MNSQTASDSPTTQSSVLESFFNDFKSAAVEGPQRTASHKLSTGASQDAKRETKQTELLPKGYGATGLTASLSPKKRTRPGAITRGTASEKEHDSVGNNGTDCRQGSSPPPPNQYVTTSSDGFYGVLNISTSTAADGDSNVRQSDGSSRGIATASITDYGSSLRFVTGTSSSSRGTKTAAAAAAASDMVATGVEEDDEEEEEEEEADDDAARSSLYEFMPTSLSRDEDNDLSGAVTSQKGAASRDVIRQSETPIPQEPPLGRLKAFRRSVKPTEEMRVLRQAHVNHISDALRLSVATAAKQPPASALEYSSVSPSDEDSHIDLTWSMMAESLPDDSAATATTDPPWSSHVAVASQDMASHDVPSVSVDSLPDVDDAALASQPRAVSIAAPKRLGSGGDIWEAAALGLATKGSASSDLAQASHGLSACQSTVASVQSRSTVATTVTPSATTTTTTEESSHLALVVSQAFFASRDHPTISLTASLLPSVTDVGHARGGHEKAQLKDWNEEEEEEEEENLQPVLRARSATVPTVRSSAFAIESHTADDVYAVRSRASSVDRRSSVRFIKAPRSSDPFTSVLEGSSYPNTPLLPTRSPLAPLLHSPSTLDASATTNTTVANQPGSRQQGKALKPMAISFRDRITTVEERRTARAFQSPETPPHSGSRPTSTGSALHRSGSLTYDGSEAESWCAKVRSPARLSLPDRHGSWPAEGRRVARSDQRTPASAHTRDDAVGAQTDTTRSTPPGADEPGWSFSSCDAPPVLTLPTRPATGARTSGVSGVTTSTQWKRTSTETGEERVVYAGECILPQVLRDHQARQQQQQQQQGGGRRKQASLGVDNASPPTIVVIKKPSPEKLREAARRRYSATATAAASSSHSSSLSDLTRAEDVHAAPQYWSPVTHSPVRGRRASPFTHPITTATARLNQGPPARQTVASVPGNCRLPEHIEHIFSLSSSLSTRATTAAGGTAVGPRPPPSFSCSGDMDEAAVVSADHLAAPQDKMSEQHAPAQTASFRSQSRQAEASRAAPRWDGVPLPALSSPMKETFSHVKKSADAMTTP